MVRIGVVNIDTSHPKAFTGILHAGDRARYVAVYNDGVRGEDEVNGFIASAGIEKRCDTVEELAGQTVRSSKEGLEKAGEAIGGSAKKAGEGIGKAGSAIGQAASNTWTCITSLFAACGGTPESEPQPEE